LRARERACLTRKSIVIRIRSKRTIFRAFSLIKEIVRRTFRALIRRRSIAFRAIRVARKTIRI
jgi:hypothetical protein